MTNKNTPTAAALLEQSPLVLQQAEAHLRAVRLAMLRECFHGILRLLWVLRLQLIEPLLLVLQDEQSLELPPRIVALLADVLVLVETADGQLLRAEACATLGLQDRLSGKRLSGGRGGCCRH